MYEYISGNLAKLEPTQAVIDCGGVGYLMEITLYTFEHLQKNEGIVKLFVHEVIREDAHILYGFFEEAEREMFRMLIGVNGVGSQTARVMLSSMSVEELCQSIANEDAKRVQKVKGIGAKTAQRIVLELKDKIGGNWKPSGNAPILQSAAKEEALSALVMLGFPKAAADKVLQGLDASLSVEELIKEALKRL